ncbi:MAG: biotin--[Oscillospiraceae bacterium]|nr:biotin--[acetyl-CoA-carboxylase] ligase [Oscillospiraceae bacterium]
MKGLKSEVLRLLEEKNDYLSGKTISTELKISRNMVWKYVLSLKNEGYEIETSRKGYLLVSKNCEISEYEIRKKLKTKDVNFSVHKSVGSTNTLARQMAEKGAGEKTVVIASEQTQGRGRRGRSFYSPDSSGIYMSILLRPDIAVAHAILVTTCAAVSVCKAIEKVSPKKADIKWVNDIYLGGKKACGILTEAALNVESGKPEYVVLGIGINLFEGENGFPDEIKDIATAVFDSQKEAEKYKNELVAHILDFFFEYYARLTDKIFFNEYRSRMFLIGKPIKVLSDPEYNAVVLDIDSNFKLKVRLENGEEKLLNSGEVSTRAY